MKEDEVKVDYHKELNRLAYDIRGCYCEQFKDRDENSIYRCLGTIKDDEPLYIIEYKGSRFVVGACRSYDENFVGTDENSYLKKRPRAVTVTLGMEINEDGTVRKGEEAKSFVIFAQSRKETFFDEKSSWRLAAKTDIEVNFLTRDPKKRSFSYPAFNVIDSEAFLCNRFYAHAEGKYFNVANRANLAKAARISGACDEIFDAIENCIVLNVCDENYAQYDVSENGKIPEINSIDQIKDETRREMIRAALQKRRIQKIRDSYLITKIRKLLGKDNDDKYFDRIKESWLFQEKMAQSPEFADVLGRVKKTSKIMVMKNDIENKEKEGNSETAKEDSEDVLLARCIAGDRGVDWSSVNATTRSIISDEFYKKYRNKLEGFLGKDNLEKLIELYEKNSIVDNFYLTRVSCDLNGYISFGCGTCFDSGSKEKVVAFEKDLCFGRLPQIGDRLVETFNLVEDPEFGTLSKTDRYIYDNGKMRHFYQVYYPEGENIKSEEIIRVTRAMQQKMGEARKFTQELQSEQSNG